jgi:hypothetical protein
MRMILAIIFMTCATQAVSGERERLEFEENFMPYVTCITLYRIANNNFDVIRHISKTEPEFVTVLEKNYQELATKLPKMLLLQTELSQAEIESYYKRAESGEKYLELHPLYGQLLEASLVKDMSIVTLMLSNCMYQFDLTYPEYN